MWPRSMPFFLFASKAKNAQPFKDVSTYFWLNVLFDVDTSRGFRHVGAEYNKYDYCRGHFG